MSRTKSVLVSAAIAIAMVGGTAGSAMAETKHYHANWWQCSIAMGTWKDKHPKGKILASCFQPLGTTGSYWMFITK